MAPCRTLTQQWVDYLAATALSTGRGYPVRCRFVTLDVAARSATRPILPRFRVTPPRWGRVLADAFPSVGAGFRC